MAGQNAMYGQIPRPASANRSSPRVGPNGSSSSVNSGTMPQMPQMSGDMNSLPSRGRDMSRQQGYQNSMYEAPGSVPLQHSSTFSSPDPRSFQSANGFNTYSSPNAYSGQNSSPRQQQQGQFQQRTPPNLSKSQFGPNTSLPVSSQVYNPSQQYASNPPPQTSYMSRPSDGISNSGYLNNAMIMPSLHHSESAPLPQGHGQAPPSQLAMPTPQVSMPANASYLNLQQNPQQQFQSNYQQSFQQPFQQQNMQPAFQNQYNQAQPGLAPSHSTPDFNKLRISDGVDPSSNMPGAWPQTSDFVPPFANKVRETSLPPAQSGRGHSRTFSVPEAEIQARQIVPPSPIPTNPKENYQSLSKPGLTRDSSPMPLPMGAGEQNSKSFSPKIGEIDKYGNRIICLPLHDLKTLKSKEKYLDPDDLPRKLDWSKQVFKKFQRSSNNKTYTSLLESAVKNILDMASSAPQAPVDKSALSLDPVQSMYAEAIYLRGDIYASGICPTVAPRNPRNAFQDYKLAASRGWSAGFFKMGREYESTKKAQMARVCFEKGVSKQDVACTYRMGMAHLLGQLEMSPDASLAIPMLRSAADLATADMPQPAYVYGVLLTGEYEAVQVPRELLEIRSGLTVEEEAWRYIEKAAYLNFPPALYKCGWCYEFALLTCGVDPLLSVQYYSQASRQGEVEADMSLSKWFLCGSDGAFQKDEKLAFVFADKAAKKGLPTAEFALGYYYEIGIGCKQNIEYALKWYNKAAEHKNRDAIERIEVLNKSQSQALTREQHEGLTEQTLTRQRTIARMRSTADGKRLSQYRPGEEDIVRQQVKIAAEMTQEQSHSRGPSGSNSIASPPLGFSKTYSLTDEPMPDELASFSTPNGGAGTAPLEFNAPILKKGPSTFAEMGFGLQQQKEKDCVIM